jgi:primosomal protein N'
MNPPMQAKVSSYVQVYLPLPKFRSFTYRVPEEWQEIPRPGQLVLAPMGRRRVIGMVSPAREGFSVPTGVEIKKLIEPLPPEYSLSPKDLELFQWAQGHYLASPG